MLNRNTTKCVPKQPANSHVPLAWQSQQPPPPAPQPRPAEPPRSDVAQMFLQKVHSRVKSESNGDAAAEPAEAAVNGDVTQAPSEDVPLSPKAVESTAAESSQPDSASVAPASTGSSTESSQTTVEERTAKAKSPEKPVTAQTPEDGAKSPTQSPTKRCECCVSTSPKRLLFFDWARRHSLWRAKR